MGEMKSPWSTSRSENRDSCKLSKVSFILWVTDTARGLGMGPATTESRFENCFLYKSIRSRSSVHHCPTVPQSGGGVSASQAVPGTSQGQVLGHTDSKCDPHQSFCQGTTQQGATLYERLQARSRSYRATSAGTITGRNMDVA